MKNKEYLTSQFDKIKIDGYKLAQREIDLLQSRYKVLGG